MATYLIGLLMVLGFGQHCWCLNPRLNVTDEFLVDLRYENSFSLRCEGSERVYWNWTHPSYTIDDTDIVTIIDEKHVNTDRPFVSTLTINGPITEECAFYRCHYEGVNNFVTETDKVASTYVYIYDGENAFAYAQSFPVTITTADKLILDCRTTMPNITVRLVKEEKEISSRFQWDPKIGFVMRNLAIHDAGFYICSADNFEDEKSFFVDVYPKESQLPKPAIDWEPNQHFVVGHPFMINCSLLIDEYVAFHWVIPNPSSNHTIDPPKNITRMGSEYRVSSLHLHDATLQDSGFYTCEVTSSQTSPNSEERRIVIEDTIEPYINISSANAIPLDEGKPLNWKTGIRVFPLDPEIIYRDWRGREVVETPNITTEHYIDSGESWLRIHNVTAKDFGNYTIEVILRDHRIRDTHTVLVEVNSKPSLSLGGIPSFIDSGMIVNAHCKSLGFPLANISWTYKSCPGGELNCTSEFSDLPLVYEDSEVLKPGNIINASISFYPKESGILSCNEENKNGESNEVFPVSISDIGGNLVFSHTGEGVTTTIAEGKKQTLKIVENDNGFQLKCGATKFLYKEESLTFSPDLTLSDIMMIKNETKFSRQVYVFADKVTEALEGRYRCSAKPHNDEAEVMNEFDIRVLDERPLTFVNNANLLPEGDTFVMTESDPFYLNCTVDGMPVPTITWYKDDEELPEEFFEEDIVSLPKPDTIYFKFLLKEYAGTYSCVAKNRLATITGYLTITTPHPGISTGGKVALAFVLIGIAVLVIVVIYLVKRVKKERRFRKSFRQNELYLFEKGNVGQLNPDCTADEQAELLPYDPVWEVEADNIKIGKQLGAGAFGRVVKAVVSELEEGKPTSTVAVKMCKSQADQSQVRALALELKIMIHLGQHLNIVNLMGANTVHIGKGELWILVEYCRFGNLLTFMHRHRNKFINQIDPVTGKIDFALTGELTAPFSPISYGSGSRGYRTAPITDVEGYLAPNTANFTLGAPPIKRTSPSPPQSPNSVTGSTNGSSQSGGSMRPHVDNPMYNMVLQRSVSENPEGDSAVRTGSVGGRSSMGKERLNSITSLNASRKQRLDSVTCSEPGGKPRLNSNTYSETGSLGYCREDAQITNTDMTILPSLTSHLSPLSPTDSTNLSDVGVDSKGNPFYYDAGIVPAITAPFTTSDLVCWAWQVAQGMEYLSSRKVLHGDLAARNLLLADDNVIKISDFGLSREMYKKDVYMKKGDDLMPIKWMALEAIRDRIFSVQSDVWAYGVTLWELFTLGSTPYPGTEVNKDFLNLLENGHRMDRPKYANTEIYDILLSCWESDPRERPTFSMAAEKLGVQMLPDLRGQYVTMNDPYVMMNEERFKNDTDYLNMLASPNFDNLNKEDEARLHYVNIGEMPDSPRDSNYLDMQSANSVGYSRVGFNPNNNINANITSVENPHYLPMGSTQETPSPMAEVFSPRPNEIPRFNFDPDSPEKPRLEHLTEEEECASQTQSKDNDNIASTERSSLLSNSSSENSSKENIASKASSKEHLHSEHSEPESEPVTYVNLPTHGVDYVNL